MAYVPLDVKCGEFRVLTLHPASTEQGSTIHCSLTTGELDTEIDYYALSYCWGDLESRTSVIVDGKQMQVTLNLNDALCELRKQGFSRLWVDALCINQDDVEERGLQVPRRGTIYTRAKSVIAWLGKGTHETNYAMDALNQDAIEIKRFDFAGGIHRSNLVDVLQNPYWKRVWIIQEISMANEVAVLLW